VDHLPTVILPPADLFGCPIEPFTDCPVEGVRAQPTASSLAFIKLPLLVSCLLRARDWSLNQSDRSHPGAIDHLREVTRMFDADGRRQIRMVSARPLRDARYHCHGSFGLKLCRASLIPSCFSPVIGSSVLLGSSPLRRSDDESRPDCVSILTLILGPSVPDSLAQGRPDRIFGISGSPSSIPLG
jgi:hypothetical protein